MSDVSAVIYFLGGGAAGAVATAVYTASHERAERFRERMLTAAESFLKAEEAAESAVEEAHNARRRQLEASVDVIRALDAVEVEEGDDEEHWVGVMERSRQLIRAINLHVDLNSAESRESVNVALGELRALRKEVGEYAGPRRPERDEFLDRLEVYGPRARDLFDAVDAMHASIGDIANGLPRLRILFARRGKDDLVMRDAFEAAHGLTAWARAWPVLPPETEELIRPEVEETTERRASDDGEEPPRADEQAADATAEREDAKTRVHRAIGSFATHVSERIRQRSP